MTMKLDKSQFNKLKVNMRFLDGASVDIGFFDSEMLDADNTLATVALWQEYGTYLRGKPHIPERPFMSHTFIFNRGYKREVTIEAGLILTGRSTTSRSLSKIGGTVRRDMKLSINNWIAPANATSTVQKKGFNKPLVHTGALSNGVRFRKRLSRRTNS